MILVSLSIIPDGTIKKKIIIRTKIKIENLVQICALFRMVQFEKIFDHGRNKMKFCQVWLKISSDEQIIPVDTI